jgi:3-deoxy-D-manno-octulosonic-acid transferase
VHVTGNLKFDVTPDAGQLALGRLWRERLDRPVLLFASTREGEEKLLFDSLPRELSDLLIVVVPRHPQRFDEVAQWAQSRRTRCEAPAPGDRVHLGDTMGEMAFYYAACDVAVIGGSFLPLGGQNLIEALAAGAPVVMGPHMFNFFEAAALAVASGAAVQAGDTPSAVREALALIGDAPRRARMARAGAALCAAHRGAAARHLAVCKKLLVSTGRAPG